MEKKTNEKSPASLRWGILRRALLSQPHHDERGIEKISRKTTGGFNLLPCHLAEQQDSSKSKTKALATAPRDVHVCYNLPPLPTVQNLILIQRTEDCIDLNDFEMSSRYDIDTTGLVCRWPSEDVLAYFCIKHSYMFRSKRVLELGSGYGLAGLAIAACTDACEVVISDGNPQVTDYVQRSIHFNAGIFGNTKVNSVTLHWNQDEATNILDTFDIIVASDCTFFKEFHESLARTVKSMLKYSDSSEAIFLSPKRGDSLDKFLAKIRDIGLHYELVDNYDNVVWDLHQKFQNGDDTSWPNYDKDHSYPLLAKITFFTPDHPSKVTVS